MKMRKKNNDGFKLKPREVNVIAVMFFGTFVTFFNQTTINPALPTIMADFGISAATAQWLFSGNTLVTAIMIPLNASFVERFSVRKIFIAAMGTYTVGCLLTAAGPIFPIILLGRLIQGMGSGVLMPTCITTLFMIFPKDRRGAVMGLFGLVIGFAPVLGPGVSGFICDNASWHWIYYITGGLSALTVIFGIFIMQEDNLTEVHNEPIDKISVVLSTCGFGLLLFGFSEVGSSGVSWYSITSMIVGAGIAVFFFIRQTKLDIPMLRVEVLKNKKFRVSTIIVCCVQMAVMGNAIIIPILVQEVLGQSATVSGLVMTPAAVVMGIVSPLAGKFFDKRGPRAMVIVGLSILVVTTLILSNIDQNITPMFLIVILCARYFGLAVVNMPVNTWGVNSLTKELIPHGNSVASTFRQTAGSFGTALTVSTFSIVYTILLNSMEQLDAGLWGINSAFMFQSVCCIAALIIAIVFVKEKKPSNNEGMAK